MANNKIREALVKAQTALVICEWPDGTCMEGVAELLRQIDAALAEPVRNCDVGDAADWERRFGEECDKGHICSDCPVRYAKTRMAIELDKGARCEFVWAQMPYVEQEGGAE